MGTTLTISVSDSTRTRGLVAVDSAFAAVRGVDDIINDWRGDSELGLFNQARPGDTVALSPALGALLAEVDGWSAATGGAMDPAVGALVDAWDLRGAGRLVADSLLAPALAASGSRALGHDSAFSWIVRRDSATWLDAGAFGKGAALRAARDALAREHTSAAILNFGGQLVVMGDTVLTVHVAHPRHRFISAARIRVHNASVSTTGQSERTRLVDSVPLGHVLDPRHGRPVAPWGSVTVVHPDPLVADILSTALFVLGPDEGLRWLEGRDIAALFLVELEGKVLPRWSARLAPLLVDPNFPSHGD